MWEGEAKKLAFRRPQISTRDEEREAPAVSIYVTLAAHTHPLTDPVASCPENSPSSSPIKCQKKEKTRRPKTVAPAPLLAVGKRRFASEGDDE